MPFSFLIVCPCEKQRTLLYAIFRDGCFVIFLVNDLSLTNIKQFCYKFAPHGGGGGDGRINISSFFEARL